MPKKTVQEPTKEPDSSGKPINEDQPDGHTVPVGGDPLNPTYDEDPMGAAANEALGGKEELPPDKDIEDGQEEEKPAKKEEGKEPDKKDDLPPDKKEPDKKEPDKKEPEPSKLTEKQEKAIAFAENFHNDPKYRAAVAKMMAEQGEIKLADDKAPTKEPVKVETDEELDALDPDIRRLVEKVADKVAESKYGSKFKEIDDFMTSSKNRAQEAAVNSARKEFMEFKAENKELIAKHEKALTEMGKQYPDLLRGGKKGLTHLLNLVAHDDIVEQKTREAVEKALKREDKIRDGVTRHSHSRGTSSSMQNDFSVKKGASFEECAEAAWDQMSRGI